MNKKEFYKSKAWKVFSKYIKLKHSYADDNDESIRYCNCATSGKQLRIGDKRLHAGHCIKIFTDMGTNFNTAFDERNVLPQCEEHNVNGGYPEIMSKRIERIFGNGTIEDLNYKKRQPFKLNKVELEIIYEKYKSKLETLENELGFKMK